MPCYYHILGKLFIFSTYVTSMPECMIKFGGLGIFDDEKCCIKLNLILNFLFIDILHLKLIQCNSICCRIFKCDFLSFIKMSSGENDFNYLLG